MGHRPLEHRLHPDWDQIAKLGLDPEHITANALHGRRPLIDLTYAIRVQDPALVNTFALIQDLIQKEVPPGQYFTPQQDFHITLYTHMYADESFQNCDITPETKAIKLPEYAAFAARQQNDVLRSHAPLEITYRSILITPDSIIAVADDNGSFQGLRQDLVKHGNLHGYYDQRDARTVYPNIIHTTLVRFITLVPIAVRQRLQQRLAELLPLDMPITLREIEYRLFDVYGEFPAGAPLAIIPLQ